MKVKAAIAATVLMISAIVFFSWSRGPDNYGECIEMNIGKAETRESAIIINEMCKKRFPRNLFTDEEVFGKR